MYGYAADMDGEIRHLSNGRIYSAAFKRSNSNDILFLATFQNQNFEFGMLPIRQNSRGHFPGNPNLASFHTSLRYNRCHPCDH